MMEHMADIDLTGTRALVTGGTSGLGLAMALSSRSLRNTGGNWRISAGSGDPRAPRSELTRSSATRLR